MNIFETALTRYLSAEHLIRIRAARIGIAGAGGLGSNVAMALVRTGFRHLEIIDKDVIEPSNLNRQDFTLADIGKPKVECLRTRLLSVNPDANIIIHRLEWTPQTASGLFQDTAIMVEAFDKAAIKTAFVEYYAPRARCVVSGNGMAGLNTGTEITARNVGNIILVGDGTTSIHDGHPPLAPRVLQCAARMAQAVLELTIA